MVRRYRNLSEEHKKKIGLGNKGKNVLMKQEIRFPNL